MAKRKRGKGRQSSAADTEKKLAADVSGRPPGAKDAPSDGDLDDEGIGAGAEASAESAADAEGVAPAENGDREDADEEEDAEEDDAEAAAVAKLAEPAAGAKPAEPAAGAKPAEPAAPVRAARGPVGAAWGRPLARFNQKWTFVEARLITFVLVWQLSALVLWVLLNGLGLPKPTVADTRDTGMVFRAVFGALVCALAGWFGSRGRALNIRRIAAAGGIVVGAVTVPLWRDVGVDYFDNVKRWLQEGSTLTLLGGLRGLGTRLTLWLALLGASLATGAGKHIHIDVIFRFLPSKLRLPATIVNYTVAAAMCIAAAWGFVDHIAIESFGSNADDNMLTERPHPAGPGMRPSKVGTILHFMGLHLFLTSKQVGLDLRSLPHVIAGEPYDGWMSAAQWNSWVKDAGFEDHYPAEQVSALVVPEDSATHTALVIAPDGDTARGILVHDLNLIFPFGMLVIALRFLLRILLALSGHIDLDPDAAHKEEILEIEHKVSDGKAPGGVS